MLKNCIIWKCYLFLGLLILLFLFFFAAHPSCLSYSQELVEQIRSDGSWQCIDCKACSICNGTGDPVSVNSSPTILLVQRSLIFVWIKEAIFCLDLSFSKLVSQSLLWKHCMVLDCHVNNFNLEQDPFNLSGTAKVLVFIY